MNGRNWPFSSPRAAHHLVQRAKLRKWFGSLSLRDCALLFAIYPRFLAANNTAILANRLHASGLLSTGQLLKKITRQRPNSEEKINVI